MATRNGYGEVNVWNVDTGQRLFHFNDRARENQGAGDSPRLDLKNPLSSMSMSMSMSKLVAKITVSAIAFSSDGTRGTFLDGANLKIWDMTNGRELRTIQEMGSSVLKLLASTLSDTFG